MSLPWFNLPQLKLPQVVIKDENGNFSANVITATLNGAANNFSGQMAGDVTGSQNSTIIEKVGNVSSLLIAQSTSKVLDATANNHTLVSRDVDGNLIDVVDISAEIVQEVDTSVSIATSAAEAASAAKIEAENAATSAIDTQAAANNSSMLATNAAAETQLIYENTMTIKNSLLDALQTIESSEAELALMKTAVENSAIEAKSSETEAVNAAATAEQSLATVESTIADVQEFKNNYMAMETRATAAAASAAADSALTLGYKTDVVALAAEAVVNADRAEAASVEAAASALTAQGYADSAEASSRSVDDIRSDISAAPLSGDVTGSLGDNKVVRIGTFTADEIVAAVEDVQAAEIFDPTMLVTKDEAGAITATTFIGDLNGTATSATLVTGIKMNNATLSLAIGLDALANVEATALNNTAIGANALKMNTTGSANSALGADTLSSNTSGINNTANGWLSMTNNTTGNDNTATGMESLRDNTSGNANTAIGHECMYTNITGSFNTALGYSALANNITGSYNTAIGADTYVSLPDLTNTTAIGYGAFVNASNKIRLGNFQVTVIEGAVPYTVMSDARVKKDIVENVPGYEFIKRLRPVTYHNDPDGIANVMEIPEDRRKRDVEIEQAKTVKTGFIAQEVEAAAQSIGYDFDGINAPAGGKGYYTLAYSQFVVPLVQACKEQHAINEERAELIRQIKARVALLENK